ncbi:hypothetical protein Micbo1qcDRAFT_64502 [Microdochium bolleyi]|uniref:Uncharacterized protein n=1 Tax=Microdochium bolleyi TaxID=196109 RepID=A0A136J2V0_9PEZI|nr:hypothetical protein Micbo1qcDRAFT_64502 [Microdochium bolleyi]
MLTASHPQTTSDSRVTMEERASRIVTAQRALAFFQGYHTPRCHDGPRPNPLSVIESASCQQGWFHTLVSHQPVSPPAAGLVAMSCQSTWSTQHEAIPGNSTRSRQLVGQCSRCTSMPSPGLPRRQQ